MIFKNTIQVRKTGRYFTIGEASKNIRNLWIVFHGYGQLADEFIKSFEKLNNPQRLIIAPEALNKFYFRGFTGKIGASWMTKEDRENEISDYLNFISSVYSTEVGKIELQIEKINVLGFSQGTHTAVRWINSSKIKLDKLILWSGGLPVDCNYTNAYWRNLKIKFIVGDKDKLIDDSILNKHKEYIKQLNLNIETINFSGGHEIKSELLEYLAAEV